MNTLKHDRSGALPVRLLAVVIVIAVLVVAVVFAVSMLSRGKGDTNLWLCADGTTLVDDPAKCPGGGNPLKLGVYSTAIQVIFLDGGSAMLTDQTPFDQLAVSYEGKPVGSFIFTSSYAAGDASLRIQVRPEVSLVTAPTFMTAVRGQTGDLVEKTIQVGRSESLFSMTVDQSFFSAIIGGVYMLKFVSHILALDVLNPDGSVKVSKQATITYSIEVTVVLGGGGGGGCKYPICHWPELDGRLSNPVLVVA